MSDPDPPPIAIFAAGALPQATPAYAGYGLYIPAHSLRIAEPLPGPVQTLERAHLHALLCALELVHGIRARAAVVHTPSARLLTAYDDALPAWAAAGFREKGRSIAGKREWQDVWKLREIFLNRGVEVDVRAMDGQKGARLAKRLARMGSAAHVTCELCGITHGREWNRHNCQPVCDLDECDGRRLKSVDAYMRHMRRRHRKSCARRENCAERFETFLSEELERHEREVHGGKVVDCRFCGTWFKSLGDMRRHVQKRCMEAPFCPECGRLCGTQKELRKHMRVAGISGRKVGKAAKARGKWILGESEEDELAADLARHEFGTYAEESEYDSSSSLGSEEGGRGWRHRREVRRKKKCRHKRHRRERKNGHQHQHEDKHVERQRPKRRYEEVMEEEEVDDDSDMGSSEFSDSDSEEERQASVAKVLNMARQEGSEWLIEEYENRRQAAAVMNSSLSRGEGGSE